MTFVLVEADLAKTDFDQMQTKKVETSMLEIAPWQIRATGVRDAS